MARPLRSRRTTRTTRHGTRSAQGPSTGGQWDQEGGTKEQNPPVQPAQPDGSAHSTAGLNMIT